MIQMTPQETALAHSRAYHLLSRVMLDEMTEEVLLIVNDLPEFANADTKTVSDWKADHYAMFGMNVYPFETVFLAEDGLLGGDITESVARAYYEAGFTSNSGETADHIGNQLALMAFLCGAEADARDDKVIQAIHHMLHLQRQFLDKHLLSWLPALRMAIHQQVDNPYRALADIALDLALSHRQTLDDDLLNPTHSQQLPAVPNILADSKTGLRDIAEFLLTPVYTGFYLSRDDIARLGTTFRLPRGFGKRDQMLSNLLHTAIDYSAIDDLIRALQGEVDTWRAFYQTLPDHHAYSAIWIRRLDDTTEFLQTIRNAL